MDYQLWLGDCLEEMDRIEDGSIDAVIADLPYGTTACAFDKRIPFEPLWKQYKRVIKRSGAIVLFGSQPFTTLLIASSPYFGTGKQWFKYEWIWHKNTVTGGINADYGPMKAHESILFFSGGRATFNKQQTPRFSKVSSDRYKYPVQSGKSPNHYPGLNPLPPTQYDSLFINPRSVLEFDCVNNCSKLHSTQKPVALLSYLIKTYTNEGDTILDNTCGSGSTLEAAMKCNRRSIGIEKDEGYYNVAKARLEKVAAELRGELNHLPMFQAESRG